MTRIEAERWVEQAQEFLGTEKPVVTESQLGLPSTIEPCKLDSVFLKEEDGDFIPVARMRSVTTGKICREENLVQTLDYLRRTGK